MYEIHENVLSVKQTAVPGITKEIELVIKHARFVSSGLYS